MWCSVASVSSSCRSKESVTECFLHWAAQVKNVLLVSCDWKNKRTQLSVMKWWNQAPNCWFPSETLIRWAEQPAFDWSVCWYDWSPVGHHAAMIHMCIPYAAGRWQTGSRAQILTAREAAWKLIAQPRWRNPPPCCVTSWNGSRVMWKHLLLHPLHSH